MGPAPTGAPTSPPRGRSPHGGPHGGLAVGGPISDIPSRDPTAWDEEARAIMAALRARMAALGICQRDLRLPTAAQLDDPAAMLAAARDLAEGVEADRRRAFTLLCGLMGGPP